MIDYEYVKKAKYLKDYKIWIEFEDGKKGEINLSKIIRKYKGVFEPLRDINYFKNFKISGGTIAWENEADIAPETLYQAFKKQNKR